MKKTVSCLLLSVAMASTVAACTTRPLSKNNNETACRETGLTDAADSRMGQLECGPVKGRGTDSDK